jgi:3-oxoacyl-[acyl-carrier-protein] synthase II
LFSTEVTQPAVAITGLGLVCALGPSLRTAWLRILAGDHGCAPIRRFDASHYAARVAAEVTPWDPAQVAVTESSPGLPPGVTRRGTQLFLAAAREAWQDAGLEPHDGDGAGVSLGLSVNYLHMRQLRDLWRCRDGEDARLDLTRAMREGVVLPSAFFRRDAAAAVRAVAIALGLTGPEAAVDTACASGAHAVLDAARLVAREEAPVMVAGGGAGLVMPLTLLAFSRLGALSTNPDPASASRPFDRRRDGFVIGEGAAAVVLELRDRARARGARVYAELAGGATTIAPGGLTEPSAGAEVEAATITLALRDAGVDPADVDFVAAHGTSTPKNDAAETAALKRALGPAAYRAAVSSHKGQLGHTLAASGAINVVLAAMAIATATVPPTAHLHEPDPDCDLDYVPHVGRSQPIRTALAHAFAFGGQNSVLVLRRPEPS